MLSFNFPVIPLLFFFFAAPFASQHVSGISPINSGCVLSGAGKDSRWELNEQGVFTVTGNGDMVQYVFETPWDQCRSSIKTVIIDAGVTSVAADAFRDCVQLTSVTLSNDVNQILARAFQNCVSLTSISIPDGVTSISEHVFEGCSSLESVEIPDSVTKIENNAFDGCRSLTSISLPKNLISIGDYAFYNCRNLESIKIPDSVTRIKNNAFDSCSSLTSISLPKNLISIDYFTFRNCVGLTSIIIPDLVTTIKGSVFKGCVHLKSINISNSVTTIENNIFDGCRSLTSISLPPNLTYIGSYAFHDCSSLSSIKVPDSVAKIENNAFDGCTSLTSVALGNDALVSQFKSVFSCFNITDIFLSDSVVSITEGAFSDFSSLRSISIPFSVSSIGKHAFDGCRSLAAINIPENVSSIGDYTFCNCSSLTSITIPGLVSSIGEHAFDGCRSLAAINIPENVHSIGDYAFYNCSFLTSITIPSSVSLIGEHAFDGCGNLSHIRYFGMYDPGCFHCFIFENCNNVNCVFVPPQYVNDSFCGEQVSKDGTCSIETSSVSESTSLQHSYNPFLSSEESTSLPLLLGILIPVFVIAAIAIILLATPIRRKLLGVLLRDKRKSNSGELSVLKNDSTNLTITAENGKKEDVFFLLNGESKKLRLTKTIGRGAFGTVWLAECDNLTFAVKEMGREFEGNQPEFEKEMDIMSKLDSPYIVHVYGSVVTNNSFFIVMEYVPHGSLSTAFEKYSFSSYMRCRFMLEVARGMEYLHSKGIIHRDLKPGNVLVSSFDPNTEVLCKITDFGESRQGLDETQSMTMTRGVGTPYYMAEEILRGDYQYSRAVDVYSFGIMCAELWNERLPYSEMSFSTPFAFMKYVTEGRRPQIRDDCPKPLAELFCRCWASNREERPPFTSVVQTLFPIVDSIGKSMPMNVVHVNVAPASRPKT